MHISQSDRAHIPGSFTTLKAPAIEDVPAQRLPEVVDTVSAMLGDIEARGMDAVIKYARELDGWQGTNLEITQNELAKTGESLSPELREALLASADNAQRNAVGADFSVYLPDDEPVTTYPVVVANILASALDALAERLAARVAPGGRIALSGILKGQEDELLARYAPWFDALSATRDGDWMRIDGIRR